MLAGYLEDILHAVAGQRVVSAVGEPADQMVAAVLRRDHHVLVIAAQGSDVGRVRCDELQNLTRSRTAVDIVAQQNKEGASTPAASA